MGILNLFGKKDVSNELTKKMPYALKMRLNPYRLLANKNNNVTLYISIKNISKEPLLTSIVVKVPKKLGFDSICLNNVREIRFGYVPPKETKELGIDIYGSVQTGAQEYKLLVTAFCHYRDYAHILNSVSKKVSLRVV
ncbi:MAG: hypothetical protein ABIG39_03830 [Candidatus Micrarchaeota archaeon]